MDQFVMQLFVIPFLSISLGIVLTVVIFNKTTRNGVNPFHWLILLVGPLISFIISFAYEMWLDLIYFNIDFSYSWSPYLPVITFIFCAVVFLAKYYAKKMNE